MPRVDTGWAVSLQLSSPSVRQPESWSDLTRLQIGLSALQVQLDFHQAQSHKVQAVNFRATLEAATWAL